MLHLVGPLVVLAYSAWKISRKKCSDESVLAWIMNVPWNVLWKIVNKRVDFHITMPLKQKCNPTRNSRLDLSEISYSSKWKSMEKFCSRAPWISNVLLADKIIDFNWPLEKFKHALSEYLKNLTRTKLNYNNMCTYHVKCRCSVCRS